MRCIQCQRKQARPDSRFCSPSCRRRFATRMVESITCVECDAQTDGILAAYAAGWKGVTADPEGCSWNFLGTCPDCQEPSAD